MCANCHHRFSTCEVTLTEIRALQAKASIYTPKEKTMINKALSLLKKAAKS